MSPDTGVKDDSGLDELSAALAESRKQFLATVSDLRPRLHRFCTRMCGSVVDGEDIVQDVLAHAFYRLSSLRDVHRLESWLFRIAHNKSVDFLRARKGQSVPFEEEADMPDRPDVKPEDRLRVGEAFATLVTRLAPKERACIVLKDALGYSLEDIAEIVESTPGGVKAALHRGRGKLETVRTEAPKTIDIEPDRRALIDTYLELFNNRDWDGVQKLLRADARLELVGQSEAVGRDYITTHYFHNYTRLPWEWKFGLAFVDGEAMVVHFRCDDAGTWSPHAVLNLAWKDGQVSVVRDYVHVDYLLEDAVVEGPLTP